ncbi:hypothetical protein VB715_01200 [Crocosphaera sp. UHCC 0190]|uniref:hypothetical protein n=1 Tax=Crocosphaera sp. UHCC 0190 TaxID=3110246 RepID=UPI002B1F5658|nr:hypothetical protein [Crocosphaera sp. UHCC 0190]MEA5508372.1 hypothetical protein [Crocosphaera sp. UHCC 0190]
MTLTKISSRSQKKFFRPRLWFEKIMALIVLANYSIVIFNLTYIPLRDFWLQGRVQIFIKLGRFERNIPPKPLRILPPIFSEIITKYDVIKGIEPHRDTARYLQRIDNLNEAVNQQVFSNKTPDERQKVTEEIEKILADLRLRSRDMINQNPFQIANKTGTLERIKNKMRQHIFETEDSSATEAFEQFWSAENFRKNGWREELNFFDERIRPLIETNYFRPVGENGQPIDNFGLIDFPFFLIFLTEFLARTWYISRRHTGVSWFDAMLWRWYDIFLLIPLFRILRIIPLTIRLNQAKLIDLKAIQKQASQGFVASIAQDITEVVILQVINQVQSSIEEGIVRDLLMQQNTHQYIDLNDINETSELVKLMSHVVIEKVLPEIRPEAEAFLQYNVEKALSQTPNYQGLANIPGLKTIQNQLTERLVSQLYYGLSVGLQGLLVEDTEFDQLLEKLIEKFSKSMGNELQEKHSIEQIESLLNDLLEEIKVNYVESLSQENVEDILEQTRALRQAANIANKT